MHTGEDASNQLADEITTRIIHSLTEHMDQLTHNAVRQLSGRLSKLERRMDDLCVRAAFSAALTTALTEDIRALPDGHLRPPPPIPGADLPRPAELDAVCAADPRDGLQELHIDVYGRKVTMLIRPGGDPDETWRSVCSGVARDAMKGTSWHSV